MKEINEAYLKKLARDLMFELNDQEVKELEVEFHDLLALIESFDAINTDGVERMIYPFEDETTFIREDVVTHVISQEDALANAAKTKAGHIHVPKVVK